MAAALSEVACIVAVEVSSGIGYKGAIPWPRIKTDLNFLKLKSMNTKQEGGISIVHIFSERTLEEILLPSSKTDKMNAVIMGRLTWESIPVKKRPLCGRYNIVLSSKSQEELAGAHMVCSSLARAMEAVTSPPLSANIESVFILGGERVYKEAMLSHCTRLYVTRVLGEFPCDAFFPAIDSQLYTINNNHGDKLVPEGMHEENGVKFKFEVYDKTKHL